MPFPFVYVCDLLDNLAELVTRDVPLIPKTLERATTEKTLDWFKRHRKTLDAFSTDDQAVMLIFTPEKQTDREYGLDAGRLEQLIARVLSLPKHLHVELQRWQEEPIRGDLAMCVERVIENMPLQIATRDQANKVTVEEIDRALLAIASHNPNSSLVVRSLATAVENYDTTDLLGNIYGRLQGREAKWLTRLILKSYGPVKFPDSLDCNASHSFLPRCVQVTAEFSIPGPVPLLREGTGVVRGIDTTKPGIDCLTIGREPISSSAPVISAAPSYFGPSNCDPVPSTSPLPVIGGTVQTGPEDASEPVSLPTPIIASENGARGAGPLPCIPMVVAGTGICRVTQHRCPLANCIFLLAPCVVSSPWLIENLLTWHGSRFITSPRALCDPSIPRRCPQTGKKYRKIALIESNRPSQTVEFLKCIGQLDLKRSKGEKQWVEVYDWRILESVTKVDRGKQLGYNPWRRCWIGAV